MSNRRVIKDAHHVDVSDAQSSGVTLTFHGRNSAGNIVQFRVRIGWWLWPYLVREMAKAWLPVRASRLREVAELDKTLKPEGTP